MGGWVHNCKHVKTFLAPLTVFEVEIRHHFLDSPPVSTCHSAEGLTTTQT